MSMPPLNSANFNALCLPDFVLDKLINELHTMASYFKDFDATSSEDLNQLESNITFLKGYYERYERLIQNGIQ